MAATYTVKQVAQILGYSTNSIYTFLKEKRIKGVRVGRGRFRVPQAELDRLLSTVKSPKAAGQEGSVNSAQFAKMIAEVTQGMAPKPDGVGEVAHGVVPAQMLTERRVEVPSYFDWFIGLSSILLGLSLSLFSKTFEESATGLLVSMKPAIQMSLVAGGLGILLADIRGMGKAMWHWIFHVILIVTYLAYAALLVAFKDIDGMLFFGGLGLVSALGTILGLGGVGSFTLYMVWILAVAGPVSLVFFAQDAHVAPWLHVFADAVPASPYILALVSLSVAAAFLLTYRSNKRAFQILVVTAGVAFTFFSFWFAAMNFWTRSLFTLFTGFFCLFCPVWLRLTFTHRHDRRTVFSLFGAVFALYVIALTVVYLFQMNMLAYARGELQRRLAYARIVIESALKESQSAIESTATNPLVEHAFVQKDTETLSAVARNFFDANSSLRRLLFVDASGDILLYYPLTNALTVKNVAFRDYFSVPVATKKLYVSDLFETRTESPLKTVVFAAPVVDGKKAVVGVLVGSLDFPGLGVKLQEITSGATGEYIVVVDRTGSRLIHPDPALVGTSIAADDALRLGLGGAGGVTEGPTNTRGQSLTAYGPVERFGWVVGIKAPLGAVLATTIAASVVIFVLIALTVFTAGLFMASWQFKRFHLEQAPQREKEGEGGQVRRIRERRQVPRLTDTGEPEPKVSDTS